MEFFLGAFEKEWEGRKAALLHERLRLRNRALEDDEYRRRGSAATSPAAGAFGSAGPASRFTRGDRGRHDGRSQGWPGEPSMRSRFSALANGSQPAVVKVASFGGGGRLSAMVSYISRNGKVAVENERGEELRGSDELSSVRGEWDHLMKNRAKSRDLGTFFVEVNGGFDHGYDLHFQANALLKRGLGDRSFAYAITPYDAAPGYRIDGVCVLRDSGGERLTGDRKSSEIVQLRLASEEHRPVQSMVFRFTGYGNGVDYGASRLRDLVEQHGGARDEGGQTIENPTQASDLVRLEWRDQLHSRKPRDVMHLILSARAGTDVDRFHASAREFLGQEFSGYRYVFSLHDPSNDPKNEREGGKRPHVHIHAIVAMRSDAGDRIETSIASFRRWRVTMAEKAREHGIRMEMTDRRDRASPPPYHRNQVRPTSRLGRTEHEGTTEAGQRRYDDKRRDIRHSTDTEKGRRYTEVAKSEWSVLAQDEEELTSRNYIKAQSARLTMAEIAGSRSFDAGVSKDNSLSHFNTNLVTLVEVVFGDDEVLQMNRVEFEGYERRVEIALFNAERSAPADEQEDFQRIVAATREHMAARRALMEQAEQDGPISERIETANDTNERWGDAVARHGYRAVEVANEVMLDLEFCREAIERADAGDVQADVRMLRENLKVEITRAAELGVAGNSLIREIAETDEELRVAIERVERSRHQSGRDGPAGKGEVLDIHRGQDPRSGGGALTEEPSEAQMLNVERLPASTRHRDEITGLGRADEPNSGASVRGSDDVLSRDEDDREL
ncbi:relaxase/mobilization nuclease domain-containing protein [Rhizobium sp. A22-96]